VNSRWLIFDEDVGCVLFCKRTWETTKSSISLSWDSLVPDFSRVVVTLARPLSESTWDLSINLADAVALIAL
jgi:hypothetical protein